MKRNFLKVLLFVSISAIILSCEKDKAEPASKATRINFGSKTFTTAGIYTLPSYVTQGKIDSSIVLAYYNPSGEAASALYSIPGMGSSGLYHIRSFIY